MQQRLKKIGQVKASIFSKQFDCVYDYWKQRAQKEFAYYEDLKFIKEHNQVSIYIVLPPLNLGEYVEF